METIDVHSKAFVVKWIQIPDHTTIIFQLKPIKRSINFEVYKSRTIGNEPEGATLDGLLTNNGNEGLSGISTPSGSHRGSISYNSSANNSSTSLQRRRSTSTLSLDERLKLSQLTKVSSYGTLNGNELFKNQLKVEKGGIYAFIFDNTFSKNYSKKVLFNKFFLKEDLKAGLSSSSSSSLNGPNQGQLHPNKGQYLQGYLLKKRRKKLQGFTKRFFVLNFKYNILNYYLNENSLKTRGEMQIILATISASKEDNTIIIDSGMEVWILKALNKEDWSNWTNALNFIKLNSKPIVENSPLSQPSTNPTTATSLIESKSVTTRQLNSAESNIQRIDEHMESRFVQTNFNFNDNAKPQLNQLLRIEQKIEEIRRLLESVEPTNDENLHKSKLQLNRLSDYVVDLVTNEKEPQPISPTNSILSQEFYDALENNHSINIDDALDKDEDLEEESSIDNHVLLLQQTEGDGDNNNSTSSKSKGQEQDYPVDDRSSSSDVSDVDIPLKSEDVDPNDHDLYPLPLPPVKRRNDIPRSTSQPPSLFSSLRKNVGKELSTISMPVTSNEPLTILQKISEAFEFTNLLDEATNEADESIKILKISTFAISSLGSLRIKERNMRKPFNPILGETFELVREDLGFRLVGEKVHHKPQIFAFHCDSADWEISLTLNPEQKFWGKSIELINNGFLILTLKKTGEVFKWQPPTTYLKNIIAGDRYSEPVNSTTVIGSNGLKGIIDFKKPANGGIFSSSKSEELTIKVVDKFNKNTSDFFVEGKWTDKLYLNNKSNHKEKIWEASKLLKNFEHKYGFSEFASNLNQVTAVESTKIPITDSRFRPDIISYESGNVNQAESLKLHIEQLQRDRRNKLAEAGGKHKPNFFIEPENNEQFDSDYKFIKGQNSYWNRRKSQKWDGITKLW